MSQAPHALPEDTAQAQNLDDAFVALSEADGIAIDLRYASTNNFLHKNIYGSFRTLYLHSIAAAKLHRAVALLRARQPGYSLIVFDGLRPNKAQEAMWEIVRHGPMRPYVADPRTGSIHNYGFAIDLSIQDAQARELDMGTPFDDFTTLSEPRHEAGFLAEGRLTADQIANRKLLRDVMEQAGFHHLPIEWWHFDAEKPDIVRRHYPRLP